MVRRLPLQPALMVASVSLVLLVWLPQVLSATSSPETGTVHSVDKRNVGVLARTGQLPSSYRPGKRYVASLARTGNLPLYVQKKLHPGMTSRNQQPELELEPGDKRYMGALARAGSLPFQFHAKRDPADDADADDLDTLKALEAETKALETVLYLESQLNLELLKEKLLDMTPSDDADDEVKRSMASLARAGNLPFKGGDAKRSVEALARAGYLPATQKTMAARSDNADDDGEGVGKRSVAALARGGQLREGKRGGIGSLARNNLLPAAKKSDEDELDALEQLIRELAQEAAQEAQAQQAAKRNVGALARGGGYGKRNLGALAKGGGYARYAKSDADAAADDDDDAFVDAKRSLASLARGRVAPLREGKRYLGALVRSQNLPFHKRDRWLGGGGEMKRVSPMAISKTWNYDAAGQGDRVVDGIAKRYVAALLRQGRLPVGPEEAAETAETAETGDEKEIEDAEQKRHVSSLKGAARSKRAATPYNLMPLPLTEEYSVANEQNGDQFEYEDDEEAAAAPAKRFLGRIPQMGRRPKTQTPPSGGRRRPALRDDDLY